jgi:hypothetical protein
MGIMTTNKDKTDYDLRRQIQGITIQLCQRDFLIAHDPNDQGISLMHLKTPDLHTNLPDHEASAFRLGLFAALPPDFLARFAKKSFNR